MVDEEHDGAYKNLEGVAIQLGLAIVRAKQMKIPIVLSSATPSLKHGNRQSLENTSDYAYQLDQDSSLNRPLV